MEKLQHISNFSYTFQLTIYVGLLIYFIHRIMIFPLDNNILNLLLVKAGDLPQSRHTLTFIAIVSLAIYCRLKFSNNVISTLHSIIIPAFLVGLSELTWNLYYWCLIIKDLDHIIWFLQIGTNIYPVFIICILTIIPLKTYRLFDHRFIYAFIALNGYMIIWYFLGFPITYSGAPTQYINDILTNFLEVGKWYLFLGLSAWSLKSDKNLQVRSRKMEKS